MTVAAAQKPERTPDVAEILKRAQAIADNRARTRAETEQARRVSPDLIAQMRDAGCSGSCSRAPMAATNYGYDVFIEAVAAVASGDGSTGWVYSLGAVHGWLMALSGRGAARGLG